MVRDIYVFSIHLHDQNNLYLTVINNYFQQIEHREKEGTISPRLHWKVAQFSEFLSQKSLFKCCEMLFLTDS